MLKNGEVPLKIPLGFPPLFACISVRAPTTESVSFRPTIAERFTTNHCKSRESIKTIVEALYVVSSEYRIYSTVYSKPHQT